MSLHLNVILNEEAWGMIEIKTHLILLYFITRFKGIFQVRKRSSFYLTIQIQSQVKHLTSLLREEK